MKSSVSLIMMMAACSLPFRAYAAAPAPFGGQRASAQLSAPAERILDEALYDLSDSFFTFPCSATGEPLPINEGELIEMEGQLYERISFVIDGAGGQHFTLNTMPVGLRGTGVTSGEEFRVTQSDLLLSNARLVGLAGAYRYELKMVGKDTQRTFWLVAQGNYLINQDGTTVVSRGGERVECKI